MIGTDRTEISPTFADRTSARTTATALLTVALLTVPAVAVAQSGPPPGDLRQAADGHWTAWNPPAPPEGAQVHVIRAGESLWSIANDLLGDPYLWPQLWEANQYILDAHWIYPGDPLLVNASQVFDTVSTEGVAQPPLADGVTDVSPADAGDVMADGDAFDALLEGEAGPGSGWDPAFADQSRGAPEPLGYEADIYCTGYIGELKEEFPYRVASSEYEFLTPTLNPQEGRSELDGIWGKTDTEKYGLGEGDIVYLQGGRADGLSPGEILTAIIPDEDKVKHPETGRTLGRYYHYLGRLRVLSVQEDTSIGEVLRICSPIPVGAGLRIFEPEPIPLRRRTPMRPVNLALADDSLQDAPMIVASYDGVVTLGKGYLVYIDHGEAQDVLPGDIFSIYRRGRSGYPPILLGELGVLSVRDNTALARILESRYSVFLGDVLMIK
ncbi:MAG: LysM domain-containing protein [Acidobacteriota bacterium]